MSFVHTPPIIASFSYISNLQCSVAMQLVNGWIFNNCIVAFGPESVSVKAFENHSIFVEDMHNDISGKLFCSIM